MNNSFNKEGHTALTRASYCSDYKCIDILLAAGADVNLRNKDGHTALHLSIFDPTDCSVKCIRRLLRAGSHINQSFSDAISNYQNALGIMLDYESRSDTDIDTLMFLHAAGETLDGTDVDKIPEGLTFEEERLQLKHMCREAIRKQLLKLDPHQHLFGRIPELGLPSIVTEYLLFNQSLDDDSDDEEEEEEEDDDDNDDGDEDSDDDEDKMFVRKYKEVLEQRQKQ